MIIEGRAWLFGDNLSATHFLSAKYDPLVRAGKFDELAAHVLEDSRPDFVQRVRSGDLLFAGNAFGTGKHLEGVVGALMALGIRAVFARSFAAGWERDSMNLGLAAVLCPGTELLREGDRVRIDLSEPFAHNLSASHRFAIVPTSASMLEMLGAGGLEAFTLRRLGRVRQTHPPP